MLADTIAVVSEDNSCGIGDRPVDASGVLLIDKTVRVTSHDVVDSIRKIYATRRVGHTGTLDPLASGLLLILVGRGTKIAPYLVGLDKTYTASIRFGAVSDTGDSDGNLTPQGDPATVDETRLHGALSAMVGEQSQQVPAFSAVRVGGRRLYQLARRGADVPQIEREITVLEAELLSYDPPIAQARFRCSSGTYIRALAESLGEMVGCGAHLCSLRREAVGRWRVADALTLDLLNRLKRERAPLPLPDPVEEFLDYPIIEVHPESVAAVTHGSPIRVDQVTKLEGEFGRGDTVLVADGGHRALAVGEALLSSDELAGASCSDKIFRYRRVLI